MDPMQEIREGFFGECEELLESLQDALAALADALAEGRETPSETVNIVFRAVHSIKGGAGAFGFDALVGFAHSYETALDALRSGRLAPDDQAMKLFFTAADLMQDHVRAARAEDPTPPADAACLSALAGLLGDGPQAATDEAEATDFQPLSLSILPQPSQDAAPWRIRFRPWSELFSSGNEPRSILMALRDLGARDVVCDLSEAPDLSALRPTHPALSWRITLPGDIAEDDLRGVFCFVEDLAEIMIARAPEAQPTAAPPAPDPAQQADDNPAQTPFAHPQPAPLPPSPPARGAATPDDRPPRADQGGEQHSTVRVDLDRIDRLVNLVGELFITQAMLAQSVTEAGLQADSSVMTGLDSFSQLTREIQDSVMMIRAQPVKPLFQRMARIIRETSASLGKETRLRTEGEATEVDKTVIERLADPLTHMIRNAVDHGLERPDIRIGAGKDPVGTVTLSARHKSGRLLIEMSDDGAGIDRARVLETAVQRGLVPPDAVLDEAETDNLLFLPGFSTAREISAVSGRGVGMDVVGSAIRALGGRISIRSTPGAGSTFSISLPLTLAVLDGMIVTVAGETMVVPLSSVLETAAVDPAEIKSIAPGVEALHLRGSFVPLYDLGVEMGFATRPRYAEDRTVLLIALENGHRAALIVDAIVEQRQVVIKGLQRSCGRIPGVAAATILGDGRIALILDPADIIHNAATAARGRDLSLAG